ncbi:HNH endonuclease [Pseudohoeflea coraliihabitans]|uniref:HNH endonuclease n=1 Tax=Pseudohoeflea coraliihabitans TaxID=2860393 RepID=A0ABS6WIA6_9HYPH|nr:HNH endonuclease signature motif containing protein [Pseudohoeflea sp. DP4N28-3]MBW3095679.1 HNH endonuclease [Pseudohoeflea sp. DP4N28-3]
MARLEFPRKVKRAAIERAAGHCEKCAAKLKPGEVEVDHILPAELGGEPTLANAQAICRVCHKAKTADDVRRIRKADRARDKASGAMRSKQKIKSRGFARKERNPKAPLPPKPLFEERKNA